MERPAAVSPQAELGLGALRVLAQWPTDWEPTRLAEALGTRADLLAEVVARLVSAGWIHAAVQSGRLTYRYADPQPTPTLDELLHVVEGASVADDCVLGLGPCAGLSGGPVCSAHGAWLRELSWSALLVTPLLPVGAAAQRSAPERWQSWPAGEADRAATRAPALAPGLDGPGPLFAPPDQPRRSAGDEPAAEPTP